MRRRGPEIGPLGICGWLFPYAQIVVAGLKSARSGFAAGCFLMRKSSSRA